MYPIERDGPEVYSIEGSIGIYQLLLANAENDSYDQYTVCMSIG